MTEQGYRALIGLVRYVERMLHVLRIMAVLGAQTIVGVFASPAAAEEARAALLRAGVPENRITVSSGLTEDGIAAEAPGQSYENQPGQPAWDSAMAPYGEAVRSGACVVSVFARSEEERQYVEQLLLKSRARATALGAERGNNRR